jgi:mannan endo-1,4-beta-mannosidase
MTARIEFSVHRLFHVGLSILIATLLLSLTLSADRSSTETETPARGATNSEVLNYLNSISGTKTVSGQHNREPNSNPVSWTNWIYSVTGKYPKLWGADFLYLEDDINNRSTMITEAKNQWNSGALVTLMWHVCPPNITQTFCDWDSGIKSDLTDDQWTELVTYSTTTTTLNHKWRDRIDEIVPYLQYLKDNGVEVLWRPLHEMNDDWCWWCGRPGPTGSLKLYQNTHDYMVYTKGLTNLIWVWNVKDVTPTTTILSATSVYTSYYPRDEDVDYVDVVSMDPLNYGFTADNYSATLIIAKDKPIAIGECGELPSPTVLAAQPRWTWFLGWAELVKASNTITEIRAVYNDPRVVKLCRVWLPLIIKGNQSLDTPTVGMLH